jgi:hypothetical protein
MSTHKLRKVHIDGDEWKYKVGYQSITVYSPYKPKGYGGDTLFYDEIGILDPQSYDSQEAPMPPSRVKEIIQKRFPR